MKILQFNKIYNCPVPPMNTTTHTINMRGIDSFIHPQNKVNINTKNNENNNFGIKLLFSGLAIGGAIFAWIKLRKPDKIQDVFKSEFKNIEQLQKNFSEIFEKDFTKEEAEQMAKKYKEICKIQDDNEYIDKLLEQLKNDYGYKNSHLTKKIMDYSRHNMPVWDGMHSDLGDVLRIRRVDGKFADRKSLFDMLFHELKHHKQFEISIATDKLAYEDVIVNKKMREYTQEQIDNDGGTQAVFNRLKKQYRLRMQPEINRIEREIGQLPKDSPLYKKGLEYIEAQRNYILVNEGLSQDYYNNILEREAYKVSSLAKEIFDI